MRRESQSQGASRDDRLTRRFRPHHDQLETRQLLSTYSLSTLAIYKDASTQPPTLVQDDQGDLFGTTRVGGTTGDGTVFEIAKGSGKITTLVSFDGKNGSSPNDLTVDSAGNLYGTTEWGGSGNDGTSLDSTSGAGTVFEVVKGSAKITTLGYFDYTNGSNPIGEVVLDAQGDLYGAAGQSGAGSLGQVFEIVKGSGQITPLASFSDNYDSEGALVMDSKGDLYGTAYSGDANALGMVFEVVKGSGTVSSLATFNARDPLTPDSGVSLDAQGDLYGTTSGPSSGSVFEIDAVSHKLTTLASFNGTGTDQIPAGGVLVDPQGDLFGTTDSGLGEAAGTAFEIKKGSGTVTTLASFSTLNVSIGSSYYGGLTLDGEGNLFGIVSDYISDDTTVFELSPDTQKTVFSNLISFTTAPAGTPTVQLSGQIAAGSQIPTGDVTITAGSATTSAIIGPSGLFTATLPIASLPQGSYTITYNYLGSTGFASTQDSTTTLSVSAAKSLLSSLPALTDPTGTGQRLIVPLGQALTFEVTFGSGGDGNARTVARAYHPAASPSGLVQLLAYDVNGTPTLLATDLVIDGIAILTAPAGSVPGNTVSIGAVYEGDTNYEKANSTNTIPISIVTPTTLSLASSSPYAAQIGPNTTLVGEGAVTLTASIQGLPASLGTPAGTVLFTATDPKTGLVVPLADPSLEEAPDGSWSASYLALNLPGTTNFQATYLPVAGSGILPPPLPATLTESAVLGITDSQDNGKAGSISFAVAQANGDGDGPKTIDNLLAPGTTITLAQPLTLQGGITLAKSTPGSEPYLILDAADLKVPAGSPASDNVVAAISVEGQGNMVEGIELIDSAQPTPRVAAKANNQPHRPLAASANPSVVGIEVGSDSNPVPTSGNTILDNRIGTDAASDLNPSLIDGVDVVDSPGNTILDNVIAGLGNGQAIGSKAQPEGAVGIRITGTLAAQNLVESNYVGTINGLKPIGNLAVGILVDNAPRNTIDAKNVVAGVEPTHLLISGPGASGNVVTNNQFGSASSAGEEVQDGIDLSLAGSNTIVGNQIVGYTRYGIYLTLPATTGNRVDDNTLNGNAGEGGIVLNDAPNNEFSLNSIEGSGTGVILFGSRTVQNSFRNNIIVNFTNLPDTIMEGAPETQFPTTGPNRNTID